jgi:protein ImuB
MFACFHIAKAPQDAGGVLVKLARMFAPQVELVSPDTVVIPIAGLRRLMGSPNQIAAEIARRSYEIGLTGNIAIAQNPDTAILAARQRPGVTIIPPGEEREYLGGLSLSALPLEEESREVLRRWGIRTLEEFCALPEAGIVERLGIAGLAILQIARGAFRRPLRALPQETSFEERLEMDDPVALLEPLLFLIARLLNTLCERLRSRSLATTQIRLRLELEDHSELNRTLQLPFATRDAKALLKLLQLELEAHPPSDAIVAMSLMLTPVEPRVIQNDLYKPPMPEPERLELTMGKIRALVGEGNVGSPELLDTHRPDAWRMRPTPPGSQTLVIQEKPKPVARLGFRYYRPPRKAQVTVEAGGAPRRIAAQVASGRVVEAAGPWRSSGDWWTKGAWRRQEWDVQIENGGLYRIYADGNLWFVEGSYD